MQLVAELRFQTVTGNQRRPDGARCVIRGIRGDEFELVCSPAQRVLDAILWFGDTSGWLVLGLCDAPQETGFHFRSGWFGDQKESWLRGLSSDEREEVVREVWSRMGTSIDGMKS